MIILRNNPFQPACRRLLSPVVLGIAVLVAGPASASSADVVISQVYGGGGNSLATYKNDFIELHNSGPVPVSINGWSVQYASAAGTTWAATNLTNVTLQPGQYYLVQEAAGTGGTVSLPTADATGSLALSATGGKVALVTSTAPLSCGSACAGNAAVKDFVGFGSANNFEGSGPTAAPSNTAAVLRNSNGCTDTDNNGADFAVGAPNPRNTAAALSVCSAPVVNGACGSSDHQTLPAIPTANLCISGTASAVGGGGHPWSWTCAGSGGGTTASCSATSTLPSGPFSIFHLNDTHARLTPHKWIIPSHGDNPPVFEDVGGAAYVAAKMLALTAAQPNSLVIDAGDISEGNPIGDMNGNGSMTQFYTLLSSKLLAQRGRGMDAVIVGNHDVRDINYINNLVALKNSGVPVLSVNVRDIATHLPYFAPYSVVTVNGTRIGILGYTTSAAEVGASLATTLEVVDCDWSGTTAPCHLADYVNELRNTQHVDVVVLVAHIGHSAIVDPVTPLLVDNALAKVPEVVVTGHWHTWAETVWQPMELNYKTIFTESASYMKYIGELNVSAGGGYVGSLQHVIRDADITPDADVQAFVDGLVTQYDASHTPHVYDVVGYTNSDLLLDNDMRWWSPDEYPWSGNNTAGQWITDAMQWKCAQLFGSCDLAVEAGGGVRSDIPKGAVSYLQVYETFPWNDDTFTRVNMSGQDIVNFLKATTMDAGFSGDLDVTAVDGVPTSVKFKGQPIDLNHTYTVGINNYMYAHPPSGYAWVDTAPLNNATLVRDGIVEFMQTQHGSPATAYQITGPRYHLNGEYAGGYRAVVTMMDDNDTKPTYDKAFIRFLGATPETLARRGNSQVPADLVNADGSINPANRLAEQELFRSFLGFKTGALHSGDIIETWGKASIYGGDPEFVDQEGIQSDGVEFKILGHDAGLAKPVFMSSIGGFLNDNYKNHYIQFIGRKVGADSVADEFGQTLKIWDATGYSTSGLVLPGNVGDNLLISGVLTMESYAFRFRGDKATVTLAALPVPTNVTSQVDPLPPSPNGTTVTLRATARVGAGGFFLAPSADAQVASGNPTTNYGTSSNLYVQSAAGGYGNERAWLKFDLSTIPAGETITGATLQLWNWKATGAALPAEVHGGSDDSWVEGALNWSTQPAFGGVLDTQTLAAGSANLWYGWNVGAFVQQKWAGTKLVSLVVKPVSEGATDTTSPSYGFDAKEFGSNAPVLRVTTLSTATAIASVQFFYRYSTNNANWGAWTPILPLAVAAPYTAGFTYPNGFGYYEFYSIATDNFGHAESAPAYAQTSVHHEAATGQAQTISFGSLSPLPVNASISLSASASSGLAVTFSSQTTSVCTVSGGLVTTIAGGTCNIAADQAGDIGYWAAAPTVARSFAVNKLAQSISFAPIADHTLGTASFAVSATATSGLPVTIAVQTPSVCSSSGDMVTLLAVGTCTLMASQFGDAAYGAAANVSQSFAVAPANGGGSQQDVPLPGWALFLLAGGLLWSMRGRFAQGRR